MKEETGILKLAFAGIVIAVICGLLISITDTITAPYIAKNERKVTENSIMSVYPNTAKYVEFALEGKTLKKADSKTGKKIPRIFASYDKDGKLSGLAIPTSGPSFASDGLKILYAYNPEKECVTGFKVLKSTETKGFGDRILDPKETAFQKSFDCLDAKLNPEKTGLARIIETVLHGKKVNSSQIDGLAGATVTSKALGAMINKSAQELLPIVAANNATLKEGNK